MSHVANLGAIHAAVVRMLPATRCERDLISGAEPDAYQLEFVLSGGCAVDHNGRREHLHQGDFTVRDMSQPSALTFPATAVTGLLRLAIPRDLATLRLLGVTKVIGVRVCGGRGPGALVAAVLTQVAQDLDVYAAAERIWISTAVLDLISAALSAVSGPPVVSDRHDELRGDIYAFVEERLGNPDLSPAMIATAHHISVRYLHKLFQGSGYTLGEWVRRRRLDRCRRDLGDPALADRPVAAVAARWGFSDAAHFSRSFQTAYQARPSDYRRDLMREQALTSRHHRCRWRSRWSPRPRPTTLTS